MEYQVKLEEKYRKTFMDLSLSDTIHQVGSQTKGPGGPFLESPANLPGPISVFGDKCFLTEVNFC